MINSLLMYAPCKFVNYLPNQYKKKKKKPSNDVKPA